MLKKAGLQATLGARQGAQAHTRLLHLPRELIPASCFSTFPPHLQADPSASVGPVSACLSPKQGARGQGPSTVRAKGSLSLLGPHQETTTETRSSSGHRGRILPTCIPRQQARLCNLLLPRPSILTSVGTSPHPWPPQGVLRVTPCQTLPDGPHPRDQTPHGSCTKESPAAGAGAIVQ